MTRKRYFSDLLFVLCVIVITMTSFSIALSTKAISHPDESVHLNAFCYFETHIWPPDLNDPTLTYSPDGWSRVYNGEVVYALFGQIGGKISPLLERTVDASRQWNATVAPEGKYHVYLPIIMRSQTCNVQALTYRLLNVTLFAMTLCLLWFGFGGFVIGRATALAFMITPQVVYIYSYANSDAWGISCSALLAIFALSCYNTLGSYRTSMILGLLTAGVILSKTPFWFALLFSWSYLAFVIWTSRRRQSLPVRILLTNIVICGFLVLLLITPLKIIYPLTQENFAQTAEAMREEHARDDFRPSKLTNGGYRLASKGIPFGAVATDPDWLRLSLKSFYGFFDHMTLESPWWAYMAALLFVIINLFLTLLSSLIHRKRLPAHWKTLVLLSIMAMILNICGSLYNSWTFDFQPQGRYLFPSLVPLVILTTGSYSAEKWTMQAFRLFLWAMMLLISLNTLRVLY